MAHKKLFDASTIDLSDTKTKIIVGAAAAGTLLAVGGALYYFNKPEDETEETDAKKTEIVVESQKIPETNTQPELIIPKEEVLSPIQKADKRKAAGNDCFKKSKYQDALECYLEAIDLYPEINCVEKSHCYQNMAAVSEKLCKLDDVVKYCSRALDLNQKYIKALQRRANALEKQGKYAASIKDWTAVCLIEGPQKSMQNGHMEISDRVLKLYGEEEAKILLENRQPILPSFTVISTAFDNIHMRDFHTDVDQNTLTNSGDKMYIEVLNMIKNKQYDLALDKLVEALKLEPIKFKSQLKCIRGIYAWFMADAKTALSCFDDVVNDSKSYMRIKIQALIHRGETNQVRGDKARALMDFNSAVGLDEDHPDPYLHRAQFYLSIERLDEATKDLERCILLDEEFAAPWQQLVYAQYQMARTINNSLLEKVYTNLGKMIEKFPNVSDVYALYGQVLQDQRQYTASLEKFEQAQKLSPGNVTYKAHIATLKMMAENNYDTALELLKEAFAEDPKCDFVLENLGMIYIQKQMYKEALDCFDRALKLVKTGAEAAHLSGLYIGIKCQWEVCEEYGVKPVNVNDLQGFGEMVTNPS